MARSANATRTTGVPYAPKPALARLVRRLALPVLAAVALAAVGCKPKGMENPPDLARTITHSRVSADADRLIQAFADQDIATVEQWMTPALKSQVSPRLLSDAALRLRADFGPPIGIMEERGHREGPLVWYSGLVIHGKSKERGGDGQLRLVLYQFALDPAAKLDKLLVREHLYLEDLEPPVDHFLPVTRFHFPSTGEWTVAHGGRRRSTNYHHGSRRQRFAYDLVMHNGGRSRPRGRSRNRDFYCYGRPVLAPAAGVIIKAVDGVAENIPGKRGRAGGNGVLIDHGFGEITSLWHFIPGTLTVKVGDQVTVGQVLGRVGNSGSSTAPHIHFHVSHNEESLQGFALPADFVDVYVDGRWRDRAMPVRGQRVRPLHSGPPTRVGRQARAPVVFLDL
ncbi:MAG: M23 family metallopeptidase [Myxococcales bacterium]|nr:M23 family metallopeptidase [Myxococcales bacterium]